MDFDRIYSVDYERVAYFDVDEYGMVVEVKKRTETCVTRIIRANKNTAKGIKESEAEKLSFNDYENSLRTLIPKHVTIKKICSDHHKLYSYSNDKIALSAFDTKRWM